ncbi:hypothetical protein T4C_3599, partial [Trichinella pseudospiralis]
NQVQDCIQSDFAALSNLSVCIPSRKETVKTFRKTLISHKAHKFSKLLKIVWFFRNDVNWSEKIRNHEWIWSHVARLLKYDFNGGEWKGNQICNLEMYWQEFMYYNSSSQDSGNAKSVSFVIAITAFASSDCIQSDFAALSNLSVCIPSRKETVKTFRKTLISHKANDVNWSEKIRNHEWIWSHVARLRISRDIPEMTHGILKIAATPNQLVS